MFGSKRTARMGEAILATAKLPKFIANCMRAWSPCASGTCYPMARWTGREHRMVLAAPDSAVFYA